MSRVFLTDWRSGGRWSKADRSRPCDAASVSNQWDRNPFGTRDVEVHVAVQPGILTYDGAPAKTFLDQALAGDADTMHATSHEQFDAYLYLGGERVKLWESGPQAVEVLNLTDPDTRAMLARRWTEFYPWATGLHLDYFSTYVGADTDEFDAAFWAKWIDGWKDLVSRIRVLRPDWKLLGQEFHRTPLSDTVDAQFFEMHPQHFGIYMAQHDERINPLDPNSPPRTPKRPLDVWEIREPGRLPAWYVQQCLDFIARRGAFVSFGRDSTAGKGLPA